MYAITFGIRCLGVSYYLFDAYTNFFSPTIVVASLCIFKGFKQVKVKKRFFKTVFLYFLHIFISYHYIQIPVSN